MVGFGAGMAGGAAVTILINAVDKSSAVFSKINTNLLAMGTGITAAGVIGAKALTGLANDASNLQESVNAVNVVYGKNAKAVLNLGKKSSKAFGMSKKAFNQGAVKFSSFAKVVAGDGGDVVNTLEEMTGRTADFASVMNIELDQAQTLMQAGLAGETEGLRRYGIDVSAATIKSYAYANGIAETGTELTEAQKIMARYESIMAQTEKTAGDFVNTSDNLANRQRILKADTENLRAELGMALLPVMEGLLDVVQGVVDWFSNLSPRMQTAATIAGLVATSLALIIGPMTIIISMFPAMIAGLSGVAGALTAVSIAGAPVWLVAIIIIAILAALIVAGYFLIKHWDKVKVAASNLRTFLINVFKGIGNGIIFVWNNILDVISGAINNTIMMINALIYAMNRIPGVNLSTIEKMDFSAAKRRYIEFGDFQEMPKAPEPPDLGDQRQSVQSNFHFENTYGTDPTDIAEALNEMLGEKINT